MCNIRKKDFYDAITGYSVGGQDYGTNASTFRKVDNVDMIFDSRGKYLGLRTCRGKLVDGKYTSKQGPSDFKSFLDLKIWAGKECNPAHFIEKRSGTFLQTSPDKRITYREK